MMRIFSANSQRGSAVFGRFVNTLLTALVCPPLASTALTQTVISILLKKQLLSTAPKLSQESWRTAALIQTKQVRPLLSQQSAGREESLAKEAENTAVPSQTKYVITDCPSRNVLF